MARLRTLLAALAACAPLAGVAAEEPSRRAICSVAGKPVLADATGTKSASSALQRCLDLAPSPWVVPPGIYRIDDALTINRGLKIVGHGATWRAGPEVRGIENQRGMTYANAIKGVEIHGLTLDGNGVERRAKGAPYCNGTPDAGNGANIYLDHVDDVVIDQLTTRNAVCGTGMNFLGKNARIVRSVFRDNGTFRKHLWSDGLTLLECERCVVEGNEFIDNSDVSFIFGGGSDTRIAYNRIVQSVPVLAALMLDNFKATRHGNFHGSVVEHNFVDCGDQRCDFGINLGPHTWYLSGYIRGGRVAHNTVRGAKIGIVAQGAGTAEHPVEVRDNAVSSPYPEGMRVWYQCGRRSTHLRLKSADSHLRVDDAHWNVGDHKLCP